MNTIDLDAFLVRALEKRSRKHPDTTRPSRPVAAALDFAARCKANIVVRPYFYPAYFPDLDIIVIPPPPYRLIKRKKFLAGNILHELTHWTGIPPRLNRPRAAAMFDTIYSKEELVAEIGSVLLSFDLGISSRPMLPNHHYLMAFLARLERPDIAMEVALAQAQEAAAFLHAIAETGPAPARGKLVMTEAREGSEFFGYL